MSLFPKFPKLEKITEMPVVPNGYSLDGAQAIHARATLALGKQAVKEMDEAFESVDHYEHELERAYVALKGRVGKARADEIARGLLDIQF